MEKNILKGLIANEYEHPLDRAALQKLEAIPGARALVKKIWEKYYDRLNYFEITGSNIEITNENYPYLYNLLIEACSILDIKKIPPLYLEASPYINAYATGVSRPLIVITYAAIERLNKAELLYVIAHELGHINSQHVLYYDLASNLSPFIEIAGQLSLGIGTLAGNGFKIALSYWRRMSEFTADRAGLLVSQDTSICMRSLIKCSGLPLDNIEIKKFEKSFIKQAEDFEDFDYGTLNKLIRFQITVDNTHPWNVLRASELLKWESSEEYNKILKRETIIEESISTPQELLCPQCNAEISENFKFCKNCGFKLQN